MDGLGSKLNRFLNKKSIKYGLPFLVVIVGGSFGLREFSQLRYQFSKVSSVKPSDFKEAGVEIKKPGEVTLETEYEKIKKMDIDNWEQVRGPRPWEEQSS
ncbi:COX16 domain containing protein [Asbolus verrucosus]|uniref:Cytochrome c oxidase assembly protein COX16 homolog, mitochondrial n=1 Tax=Asbolus verrucosus TaxID=1661398 RepID=A0A482V6B3_ASBVE|nr:COX16 domain containing protein [Asbolus verrucosus]